jgi:tRNA G46 methylase TrmB
VEVVRASREQTAFYSIWSGHEWRKERDYYQCHRRRFDHCALLITNHSGLTFEMSNFAGYGWEHLPEGSLVVDVGGGIGVQSLTLAKHNPHLRFVVQDLESVTGNAIEVCAKNQITHSNTWRVLIMPVVLEEEHAR